jgi:hypothetical protein
MINQNRERFSFFIFLRKKKKEGLVVFASKLGIMVRLMKSNPDNLKFEIK